MFDLRSATLTRLPPLPRVILDKVPVPSFDRTLLALTKRRPKYEVMNQQTYQLYLLTPALLIYTDDSGAYLSAGTQVIRVLSQPSCSAIAVVKARQGRNTAARLTACRLEGLWVLLEQVDILVGESGQLSRKTQTFKFARGDISPGQV